MLRALLVAAVCFVGFASADEPKAKRKAKRPPAHAALPSFSKYAPPNIGDRGQLVGCRFKVIQVLTDDTALVALEWYTKVPGPNGKDMLDEHKETALFRGDTTKLIDDRLVDDTRIFKVTGKHTYRNTFGTRTVIVIEPEIANERQADKQPGNDP